VVGAGDGMQASPICGRQSRAPIESRDSRASGTEDSGSDVVESEVWLRESWNRRSGCASRVRDAASGLHAVERS